MTEWGARQARYWQSLASRYDGLYSGPWSAWEDAKTDSAIGRIPWTTMERPRVLDLGCGTGFGFHAAARCSPTAPAYVGIDLSTAMLAIASAKVPTGQFQEMAMTELKPRLAGHRFDVVLALNGALSYSEDPVSTLRQAISLAPPSGQHLVLSVISRLSVRRLIRGRLGPSEVYPTRGDLGHGVPVHVFSSGELREIVQSLGGRVHRVQGIGVLAGVLERWPAQYLDRIANPYVPDVCHALLLEASLA